jgi:uncharacterized membrane protein
MTISNYLVAWTALGAVLFCILYALVAPFYKSEGGWNMMSFMVVIAAMVTLSIYFRYSGGKAPEWLAVILWGAAGLCVWWRIVMMIRVQRKPPRK